MRIETIAIHAGREIDGATGAITPPIHLSTTFQRGVDGSFPGGYVYTRSGNPNRAALETCLARLEGGVDAIAFASGSAATTAIIQSLKAGDHLLAPQDAYYGTSQILEKLFAHWGLQVTWVDMTDLRQVKAAIQANTTLIWIETPSNPLLRITDIRGVAELAHQAGAYCVCDNTWATPMLQHPFDLGVDLILHSTTKYLGGHSDLLGGAVVTAQVHPLWQKMREIQQYGGAVPSPFDCWLLLRGMQTLPYRMRSHCDNADAVASFLVGHPSVSAVHYPGLNTHPGHEIADQQMDRCGGMMSFQVKGGREAAFALIARLQIIKRATSLGGVESLIEHRASIEGAATRTPSDLLRVSVGLEHPQDLIEDLAQALAISNTSRY